ncbi:unnamed protein product [Heligmosomoides polygyrus]|uniref:Guanylate cyclase domain-containing protein n=1 Tax=Heligmosomoides polygyrus TaxID=6339 RepID=A0A183G5Y4_HELPZ|nr:unnamed protein product [Heligmosomoides polygyrus]
MDSLPDDSDSQDTPDNFEDDKTIQEGIAAKHKTLTNIRTRVAQASRQGTRRQREGLAFEGSDEGMDEAPPKKVSPIVATTTAVPTSQLTIAYPKSSIAKQQSPADSRRSRKSFIARNRRHQVELLNRRVAVTAERSRSTQETRWSVVSQWTWDEASRPFYVEVQGLRGVGVTVSERFRDSIVENVGDGYLLVSGLEPTPYHLREVCRIALDIIHFVDHYHIKHNAKLTMKVKLGIHSGAVASGILGSSAPRFCIFGDTVNMACRMANLSEPQKIQVELSMSESIAETVRTRYPGFNLEERGFVDVKVCRNTRSVSQMLLHAIAQISHIERMS